MHGSFPAPSARAALRAPPAAPFKRPAGAARPAAAARPRECLECGTALAETAQVTAEFCCSGHRIGWNNRRMVRGAQLYDCWMLIRYERGLARLRGLFQLMGALAAAYRAADRHYRAGRRSWRSCSGLLDSIPQAYGKGGDNR